MKMEDIKLELEYLYITDGISLSGNNVSFNQLNSNYIRLYEKNGFLKAASKHSANYNFNKNVYRKNGKFYLNCAILPKLIISDELKEYLIKERFVEKTKDSGLYLIQFGNYIAYEYYDRYSNDLQGKELDKSIFDPSTNTRYKLFESDKGNSLYIIKNKSSKILIGPLFWYLNPLLNELRAKNAIIGDFPLYSGLHKVNNVMFEESLLYDFLKNGFIKDAFQFEEVFERPINVINNKNKHEEESEIQNEVNSIRKLIPNDVNKFIFQDRLDTLIKRYNNDLSDYLNSIGKPLVFGVKDDNTSLEQFLYELKLLRDDIIDYKGNTQVYNDLLKYISEIETAINNRTVGFPDEFLTFIIDLYNGPLDYLNNNKYNDILLKELCHNPRIIILDHMKQILSTNVTSDMPYKDINGFVYSLRQKLHPILIDISQDVRSKAAEEREKIQLDKFNELKDKAYKNYYKNLIGLLSNSLEETYNETEELFVKSGYDVSDIKKIYTKPIDYTKSSDLIIRDMLNKYRKLKSIYLDVSFNDEIKEEVSRKRVK